MVVALGVSAWCLLFGVGLGSSGTSSYVQSQTSLEAYEGSHRFDLRKHKGTHLATLYLFKISELKQQLS